MPMSNVSQLVAKQPVPRDVVIDRGMASSFLEAHMNWQGEHDWSDLEPGAVVDMLVSFARDMVLLDRSR